MNVFRFSLLSLALSVVSSARASEYAPAVPVDVAFTASIDGSEQRYVELLPSPFEPMHVHDVVIALHGHGSDRWQFIKDNRGECKGVRDAAAKYGLMVVSPDYRAKTSWMGPKAEADVVQIIGEVRKRHHVNRVFIAGGSMGGTSALTFAALHPELIAGVCSLNGTANLVEYDKFQDAISASFGGSKTEVPEEYKKRSAEFWPDKFTVPIALTTGGKDETVPPQSVLRLAEKLKEAKRKVLSIHREAVGHSTSYEDTVAAMEFMLKEAGSIAVADREAWMKAAAITMTTNNADLRADAEIFGKGVSWALRYDTALQTGDLAMIKKAQERLAQRAGALSSNQESWITKKGKVARGFVSAIDGSVQPYGVIIPKSYDGTRPMRLDVVLHGSSKPVGMSELKFINRLDEGDDDKGNAPDVDYIELHPLGRVENCYRWAGETDVFEAIEAACRNYKIDRDRIVLRGMSMGASGTWHLGLKYPERFVAIGPYCGYVDTHRFSETPIPGFIKVGPLPPHHRPAHAASVGDRAHEGKARAVPPHCGARRLRHRPARLHAKRMARNRPRSRKRHPAQVWRARPRPLRHPVRVPHPRNHRRLPARREKLQPKPHGQRCHAPATAYPEHRPGRRRHRRPRRKRKPRPACRRSRESPTPPPRSRRHPHHRPSECPPRHRSLARAADGGVEEWGGGKVRQMPVHADLSTNAAFSPVRAVRSAILAQAARLVN